MTFDLRKFRRDKGLSQKELAAKLCIGQSFISQIETGKDPMPDELRHKLVTIFGEIPMDDSNNISNSDGHPNIFEDTQNRFFEALKRRDMQIDELLDQQKRLIGVIEHLHGIQSSGYQISPPLVDSRQNTL